MKNILKIAFFAILLSVVACGEAIAEKETATASPITESMVKETPKPVMRETPAKPIESAAMEEKVTAKSEPIETKVTPAKAPIKKEVKETVAPVKKEVEKVVPTKEVIEEKVVPATNTTKPAVEAVKEMPKVEPPVKVTTPTPTPKKEVKPEPKAFSHAAWNTLAQKHISATGKVNYKGFKADIAAFDGYLKSLADNPVQSSWSRGEKMAYWINAYNAFTIKLIVDNYPVKSIMDLEGGKPWDKKWIKLGDKTYSLNNIEHDILRPKYKDARIHFAVNCAAKSCPPVWNKAWTAANLNGQLERSAKAFINNSKYNSVGGSKAAISKIFEWYAVDFGNITDYLNKYANTKVAAGTMVTYQEYNWALNE